MSGTFSPFNGLLPFNDRVYRNWASQRFLSDPYNGFVLEFLKPYNILATGLPGAGPGVVLSAIRGSLATLLLVMTLSALVGEPVVDGQGLGSMLSSLTEPVISDSLADSEGDRSAGK